MRAGCSILRCVDPKKAKSRKTRRQMTKAELLRHLDALERGTPLGHLAFEHERLLHTLQRRQDELEKQSQALRATQLLLKNSRDRYADLYDCAPVGYVTLDDQGIIRELNPTAAGMLGKDRPWLVGTPFLLHVAEEDQVLFRTHLDQVTGPEERVTNVLHLPRKGDTTLVVLMQSVLFYNAEAQTHQCRTTLTDITGRQQAAEALRENELRLRLSIQSANMGLWDWDLITNAVYFSPEWKGQLGYAQEEIAHRFEEWQSRLHPEDLERALQTVNAFLANPQGRYACEFRLRHKDGTYRWIGAQGDVLRDAAGKPVRLLGCHFDITARKLAERRHDLQYDVAGLLAAAPSLTETIEILLQTVARALEWDVAQFWEAETEAPDKLRTELTWHGPDRKLAAYVKRARKLSFSPTVGLPGQVLASGQIEWVPEISQCAHFVLKREAVQAGLHAALAFPILLHNRPLGTMVFLARHMTAPDEDLRRLLASLGSQIGQFMERKRVDAARLRFVALADSSSEFIGMADLNLKPFYVNAAGLRMVGLGDLATACRHRVQDYFFPEDQPFITHEFFPRVLGDGQGEVQIRFRHFQTGAAVWMRYYVFPLRGADGTPLGWATVSRNITERLELERQILDTSEREQRKFGFDLHDGLGQQLTGLSMLSHALSEDLQGHAPALIKQALRLSSGLNATVTQARLLSHGLAPVPLEGDGLMRGLAELAANARRLPGVKCRLHCDPPVELPDVAVATHLYRIAQEAVNNALKHGRASRVDITLTELPGTVELCVKNNGRAMPREKAAHGSLGLQTMRHRAEMIGARLTIQSGKTKGVQITCTLRRNP